MDIHTAKTDNPLTATITLQDLKNYLRIDTDMTDDDNFILSLQAAAVRYIEEKTGRKYEDAGKDKDIYDICIRLLISNWYDNRQSQVSRAGTMQKYEHTIDAIISHLATCTPLPDKAAQK